jgi:hypothetical protein
MDVIEQLRPEQLTAGQAVTLVFALAFLVEASVEYLVGKLADRFPKLGEYKFLLPYVALAVSIPLAFYYQVDLITLITGELPTPVGIVLTGFVMSRGAGFVNDFLTFLTAKLKV